MNRSTDPANGAAVTAPSARRTAQILSHLKCAAATAPQTSKNAPPAPIAVPSTEYLRKWKEAYTAYLHEEPEKHEVTRRSESAMAHFATTDPEILQTFEDATAGLDYNVADYLPGPFQDVGPGKRYPTKYHVWAESQFHTGRGNNHVYFQELRERYGKQGYASNIVVPIVRFERTDGGAGKLSGPVLAQQVVIAHPDDCERIARQHVKKQPNFVGTLMSSLISTTDNTNWRNQRNELNEAFLPVAAISQTLPISLRRSRECVSKLAALAAENPRSEVEMNDFFLYETQAQLQMAIFGNSPSFMRETNEAIRGVFAGTADPRYGREWGLQVLDGTAAGPDNVPVAPADLVPPSCAMHRSKRPGAAAAAARNGCPMAPAAASSVKGPLTRKLMESEANFPSRWGNTMLFAFAGHDTTGHTLTWLMFELSRHPELQSRLIAEVDHFWAEKGGAPIEYTDFVKLPFMTRCIMETLRRWPAVANGTFRELVRDDEVLGGGPDGSELVRLPAGTWVQVSTIARHHNPDLWGPTAKQFDPDREWREDELWHGQVFKAYNPSTTRFSPFTFAPRDCIGKNFAQMEMRAILLHILRYFRFELAAEMAPGNPSGYDPEMMQGVNYGTLAPLDISQPEPVPRIGVPPRILNGLRLKVVPRQ